MELNVIDFKLSELAAAAGARLIGSDATVTKVATDSRKCEGALFIALKGERFDAHDFIESAVKNGAAAVGVSRDLGIKLNVPVVMCEDTLRLLGLCGQLVRQQSKARIVSLTGSCGKTTVKELTTLILSENGRTIATSGNFNNDVGVPLTLLRIEPDTEFAVIEQGASHLGDIRRTCEFVKADTALINNVGGAHIEGFGSFEGVYQGKSEILDDVLSRGGSAVIPSDSTWYERWQYDYASAIASGKLKTFGSSQKDFVRVANIKSTRDSVSFDITACDRQFSVSLNMMGEHNAYNAAAACALSLISGAIAASLKAGLAKASNMKGRLFLKDLGSFTLIDDAYNASFNAVLAAVDALSRCEGRRILIFGDMGELGAEAESLHSKVGAYAKDRIDEIWCVGKQTMATVRAAESKGRHFDTKEELTEAALSLIKDGTYCSFLIKGSHAMHMEEITDRLLAQENQK